jgi:hypothetical protein
VVAVPRPEPVCRPPTSQPKAHFVGNSQSKEQFVALSGDRAGLLDGDELLFRLSGGLTECSFD